MMHLWVAERYVEMRGVVDEGMVRGIVVGSEFPDIRYLTRMSRSVTHPEVGGIGDVDVCVDGFERGMKLHVWLDVVREEFVREEVYGVVARYAEGHKATLLKLIEEEILADCYDGRRWSSCFDVVMEGERRFAGEDVIRKWHGMVQWAMAVRPSWLLWGRSYWGGAFGVGAETLYRWSYVVPELKKMRIFQEHVRGLLVHIEKELQNL